MIRVIIKTPSRLHMTLIDLDGSLGRIDGGVGIALERPRVALEAELMKDGILIEGDDDGRTFEVVNIVLKNYGLRGGVHIRVLEKYDEHVGLGLGTQLSLATAFSIAKLHGICVDTKELAKVVGRGGTSGIGVAAFEAGGMIVDGGHTFGQDRQKQSFLPSSASKAPPAPVISRLDFPEDWLIVLATPKENQRIHGSLEVELFSKHCPVPISEVQALSHIILMKLLPSVVTKDIAEFGEAVFLMQRIGFKKIELNLQSNRVKEVMAAMADTSSYGVGLSSFGPTLYTVVDSTKKAKAIAKAAEDEMKETGGVVLITKANNKGTEVSVI
ncbi:MAG: beta-ribofuranosylaminobenzene 5'-phosphate synthase [Nitrososphaerales archaeon]